MICGDCGTVLNDEEIHYYAIDGVGRCEACETEWHRQIRLWRDGADNPEFDAVFSATKGAMQ